VSSRKSLRNLFQELPITASEGAPLSGAQIPWRQGDYVARGVDGEPLVLVAVEATDSVPPSLRLRHVRVDYSATCRIRDGSARLTEGCFAVIACSADDPELFNFFLNGADAMVAALPVGSPVAEVRRSVSAFVELFRVLAAPASRTIAGLWAELFVISEQPNAVRWMGAWREQVSDKYDFSFDGIRLDVKASEMPTRIHHFSLEQLVPPRPARGYIVSIKLRRSAGGIGLVDLAERVARRVTSVPALGEKLWRNMSESLGSDFCESLDVRFDEEFAREQLRVIDSSAIPSVHEYDTGVFDIRFCADISTICDESATSLEDLAEASKTAGGALA
jgi:putative PD-(D/E)XK family protein DUF4420